jgi:hypothetical protein
LIKRGGPVLIFLTIGFCGRAWRWPDAVAEFILVCVGSAG